MLLTVLVNTVRKNVHQITKTNPRERERTEITCDFVVPPAQMTELKRAFPKAMSRFSQPRHNQHRITIGGVLHAKLSIMGSTKSTERSNLGGFNTYLDPKYLALVNLKREVSTFHSQRARKRWNIVTNMVHTLMPLFTLLRINVGRFRLKRISIAPYRFRLFKRSSENATSSSHVTFRGGKLKRTY